MKKREEYISPAAAKAAGRHEDQTGHPTTTLYDDDNCAMGMCCAHPSCDWMRYNVQPRKTIGDYAAERNVSRVELAISMLGKRATFEATICRPYINILIEESRRLTTDNARLMDETHRWSAAVKKLEAERVAPSLVKSPLVGIAGAAYSWRDAKNDPPTEFDPEDEFFSRKFIICIDGKVSTDAGYFTKSGRWIIAGRHGDAVNVTHYRDYPADPIA